MADRPLPVYSGNEPYLFVTCSHEDSDLVYPQISCFRIKGLMLSGTKASVPLQCGAMNLPKQFEMYDSRHTVRSDHLAEIRRGQSDRDS